MYFDDFLSFPGYPGLPEQNFDQVLFDAFLHKVQAMKFDLIIQMQGNGTIVNQLLQVFWRPIPCRILPGGTRPTPK